MFQNPSDHAPSMSSLSAPEPAVVQPFRYSLRKGMRVALLEAGPMLDKKT